jgi:hypothetical protein
MACLVADYSAFNHVTAAEVALYGNNGTQIPRSSLTFALQPGTWERNVASKCNDGILNGGASTASLW